jgi:putative glutamine amidotransferase
VPHETVYGVQSEHDEYELAAVTAALRLDLPTLAICRGFQLLNVALGGSLHQHITDAETTVLHRGHLHEVELEPGSRTAVAMGTTRPVGWSQHHQAVDRVGLGLTVTGRAADGTIEAMEYDGGWVVAVQWHPEDTAEEDPAQQRLFDAFVAECRVRRRR